MGQERRRGLKVIRPLSLALALFCGTSPLFAKLAKADHESEHFSPPPCSVKLTLEEIDPRSALLKFDIGAGMVAIVRSFHDDCGRGPFFWKILCPVSDLPDLDIKRIKAQLEGLTIVELMRRPTIIDDCIEFEGQAQVGQVASMEPTGYHYLRLTEKEVKTGPRFVAVGFMLTRNWFPLVIVFSDPVRILPRA